MQNYSGMSFHTEISYLHRSTCEDGLEHNAFWNTHGRTCREVTATTAIRILHASEPRVEPAWGSVTNQQVGIQNEGNSEP